MRPQESSFHRRLLADQSGVALVAVLLLSSLLLALGTFGSRNAHTELQIAANDLHYNKALGVAEAGVGHAYALLKADADGFNDELGNGGTGGALAALGSVTTVGGQSYRFRQFGVAPDDGYYVRVVDNFDETSGANDLTDDIDVSVKIIARSRVGSAERIVEAVVMADKGLWPGAIVGKDQITLSGGSWTDSYNSGAGAYDPLTAFSRGHLMSSLGDINLTGSSTVNGDATAGGTVSGNVTGTVTENAPPLDLPSIPPCGPPYSDGTGITGVDDWEYDPVTGELAGSGGAGLTLAPGTYCFGRINLSGGSTLTVNGPVTVSLTGEGGKTVLSGGGVWNTTQIPKNLTVYASAGTPKVEISGGGGAYMAVYAPDSEIVFSGGSEFYGAVVGGSKVVNSGGTNVHYDEALGGGGGNETIVAWREVRGD